MLSIQTIYGSEEDPNTITKCQEIKLHYYPPKQNFEYSSQKNWIQSMHEQLILLSAAAPQIPKPHLHEIKG